MTSGISGTSARPNTSPTKTLSSTPVIKPQVSKESDKPDYTKERHFVVGGKTLGVAFKNGERPSLDEGIELKLPDETSK